MTEERKPGDRPTRRKGWKQDPDTVKSDILRVAGEVFARQGLSGARVDEIAARTETSKRMIYYYLGDKEGLYLRALEEAYKGVRARETELDLAGLSPVEALRRVVEFTFDHHREHPEFIRMVMIENIHDGAYLDRSETIRELNKGAIGKLEEIIDRGCNEGIFRPGTDPLVVHWQISALSFFNVSNRPTFTRIFGDDLARETGQARLREAAVQSVIRPVLNED